MYLIPSLGSWLTTFTFDLCACYKTTAVLDSFNKPNIKSCMIPAGCIGLLSSLNVLFNKSLKEQIQDLTE